MSPAQMWHNLFRMKIRKYDHTNQKIGLESCEDARLKLPTSL